MRTSHRRDDFIRAAVEGVTFGLHYAFGALRRAGVHDEGIYLVGGGSQSDEWAQLVADVIGLPVRRGIAEAAGTGAALQARWVIDGEEPIVTTDGGWQPRPDPALEEARERVARLRDLAIGGAL